ncbi:LysR family transcriptional regulator [Diaphorobacter aerolatus]|uniref:LysR family transcriptional regulator n=1 Tax=Diaphorobacter aerolatus TaxID=1288495 RepID=A0A7H0GQ39_9BURK|nr:LysR family transcriptional regulator [Diaphorobacter aerolatus]QNP50405.1 LysR family transcriptional regulator [Diaphorobacter aerolatus]
MEFRLLRYFAALADELHFGRAAARLSISQPPLSVAIKQLEEQVQAQLFERNSKEVRLTAAGEHLLPRARQILALSSQAAQETSDVARGVRGHLRVGFVGASLYRGVPQALQAFQALHPQVRVDMLELNSAEQLQELQQARLDLGLVHSVRPPDDVSSLKLMDEPFMACLPEGHALTALDVIQLPELKNERLILFLSQVSPIYHRRIIEMCQAHGFSPEIRHEVRHWLSVLSLVSLGQGVAIAPASLQRVGMPRVIFKPLAGEQPVSELLAVWRKTPDNPLVQALLGCLREATGDQFPQ